MNDYYPEAYASSYITGSVLHIIFRNEENGYTVLVIKVKKSEPKLDEKKMSIVGYFPEIDSEEMYRFEGAYKDHPRFGKQYVVQSYEKLVPTEKEALIGYLSSDRFPGIGEKTAGKLVEAYGENVISHVLDDPERLKEVVGWNEEKRNKVYQAMLENQGMERAITRLTRLGFGMELAVKIYNSYKEQTLHIIESSPYQLVWDIQGIGFVKADRLGKSLGIKHDDLERVKAGILYLLYEKTMQEGHVYVPALDLLEEAGELLKERQPMEADLLAEGLRVLEQEEKVSREDQFVYVSSLYYAEKGFAAKVRKMAESGELEETFPESEFLEALGETEEKYSIEYAEQQKEAIKQAIHSKIMILTGGPGTGKTTVIRAIVEVFASLHGFPLDPKEYKKDEAYPIVLAAPTGRAAKRMKESTGLAASTIHKLLGFNGEEGMDIEAREDDLYLPGKLLIIDEVSMVDMWLANQLFRAVPDDMQVILVGDEDQLPSVGPGQVLTDLIESDKLPVVSLSVVYRQAEGSSIIDLAHAIKAGGLPEDIKGKYPDRRFFPCSKAQTAELIVKVCDGAVKKGYDPMDIQVLAPMYRGPAGVHELNKQLQHLFNPLSQKKKTVSFGEVTYQKDDIVLQLVNNPEQGVFNGDRGRIEAIFEAKETADKQMQVIITFDNKEVTYSRQDLNQIMLAYCSSIHKSQGSEFPIVVVPMLMAYRRMLRRNLVYTAITRAKDYLILCGEYEALELAVQTEHKDTRYTRLKEKLETPSDETVNK